MEWTSLIKQHMPDDPDVHWNCTRSMLAAMNVEYYSLCGPGPPPLRFIACVHHTPLPHSTSTRPVLSSTTLPYFHTHSPTQGPLDPRPSQHTKHCTPCHSQPHWSHTARAAGIDEDEWKLIKERNLLTQDECEKVKAYTGFKPFLP
eukprot:1925235-Prymnesium_polylepis.1